MDRERGGGGERIEWEGVFLQKNRERERWREAGRKLKLENGQDVCTDEERLAFVFFRMTKELKDM